MPSRQRQHVRSQIRNLLAVEALEARALLAGYQTHLAKPVQPVELIAAVASLTGHISARGPSPDHD